MGVESDGEIFVKAEHDARRQDYGGDHSGHRAQHPVGGYFLLTRLMNKSSGYMDNPLLQNFFRAGDAHAGVIMILSLVCQVLADAAVLPGPISWLVRVSVPQAAILIPIGFFMSVTVADGEPAGRGGGVDLRWGRGASLIVDK